MYERYSAYRRPQFMGDRPPERPHERPPEKPIRPPFRPPASGGLDSGDLMLLLLFYLLYRQSRDEEFLIILAVLALDTLGGQSFLSSLMSF